MVIKLKNETEDGIPLEVTYLPEKGMNMASYKRGGVEVIDASTKADFEKRFAGLGALIGPHFHTRNPAVIPPIKDESLFPHIAEIKKEHRTDPFSHGIGRYAPWKFEASETKVTATLSGKETWMGIPLSDLEGQQFKMTFESELTPSGLKLNLSVTSDADSIVGIHYYYRLPHGKGRVLSRVQNRCIIDRQLQPVPSFWGYDEKHHLTYELDKDTDFTFHPFPDSREGRILLDTDEYQLLTTYTCISQENAFQLYHPKGASFVCIEPVSAQDPRAANLTASSISIHLQILSPKSLRQ